MSGAVASFLLAWPACHHRLVRLPTHHVVHWLVSLPRAIGSVYKSKMMFGYQCLSRVHCEMFCFQYASRYADCNFTIRCIFCSVRYASIWGRPKQLLFASKLTGRAKETYHLITKVHCTSKLLRRRTLSFASTSDWKLQTPSLVRQNLNTQSTVPLHLYFFSTFAYVK